MALARNVTLISAQNVQRMDAHGAYKTLFEVSLRTDDKKKVSAVVFYPVARGMRYLKPGDRLEVWLETMTAKWVNSLGDVDLLTENNVLYMERK